MSDEPVLTNKTAKIHRPFPGPMPHYNVIPEAWLHAACKRAYGPNWEYDQVCGDCISTDEHPVYRERFRFKHTREVTQ